MSRYRDIYPEDPLLTNESLKGNLATELLTLNYFEADPAEMPYQVYDEHHIMINLREKPQHVHNLRNDQLHDYMLKQYEIAVTPAGVKNSWKWFEKTRVIIVTLDPIKFEQFAQKEVGVLLSNQQLNDVPLFKDKDICDAAFFVYQALESRGIGYEVMFESFARVFLVKLIQKYGEKDDNEYEFKKGFSSNQYKQVLDLVKRKFAAPLSVEDLANAAAISPHHFSRLFKETIGKTPMNFVQEHRVEESKKLLKDVDLPLIEIAARCGFSDQAHFSRVFKQYLNTTPKQFRKNL